MSAVDKKRPSLVGSCNEAVQMWVSSSDKGHPIAMFHYVARPPVRCRHRALFFAPTAFKSFLRTLKKEDVKTVGLGSYANCRSEGERRVTITFDDGSADVIKNALPALEIHGFDSTVFLVADKVGGWNDWDIYEGDAPVRLADEVQIQEWLREGQHIGSHGLSHRSLLEMSTAEARREIIESRLRLEDRFGVPVEHFCYPYGAVNEVIRDIVAESGYRTACSTRIGANQPSEDPFLLKRTPVEHRRAWMASICPASLASWC